MIAFPQDHMALCQVITGGTCLVEPTWERSQAPEKQTLKNDKRDKDITVLDSGLLLKEVIHLICNANTILKLVLSNTDTTSGKGKGKGKRMF